MKNISISPIEALKSMAVNRELIIALIRRDAFGRYRGSFMGVIWSFITPILMLMVYTFVFSSVFKMKWSASSDSNLEFSLIMFSGLIVFNLFSECANRSPGLIISNVSYVKKVIFPLEILSVTMLGSAVIHMSINFTVWLIAYFILFGAPPLTIFLLPIVILPLLLIILGISWFLASLGVYIKDITQFIGMLITILMFLSPIFYPVSSIPESYRSLLQLNPLTQVLENVRGVLFWGNVPNIYSWTQFFIISVLVSWIGYAWFQITRKGFADVL